MARLGIGDKILNIMEWYNEYTKVEITQGSITTTTMPPSTNLRINYVSVLKGNVADEATGTRDLPTLRLRVTVPFKYLRFKTLSGFAMSFFKRISVLESLQNPY